MAPFLEELKRRKVYRAGAAYVAVGLGVLGAAELILDPLGLGAYLRLMVVIVLLGFPIALVLAWAYDVRPERSPGEEAGSMGKGPSGRGAEPANNPATASIPLRDSGTSVPAFPQEIRFCTTGDGVRIAYSVVGSGPPLVRVLGWFTHLEVEWRWPELRHFWERLAEHFTVVRYDGRGIGMSDDWRGEFTEEGRLRDVDAVLDAVGIRTTAMLGISEGGWTAANYALRNPDRVSHLVFYGSYSRGLAARPGYDPEEDAAMMTLVGKGWGRSDPSFRQLFTSDFFSLDAEPALLARFDEMQRASADPDTAVRYMDALHHGRGDGTELFERVRTPSLVLHQRGDRAVRFEEGRRLAALVPGARFQPLSGSDHYFPLSYESTAEVTAQIIRFLDGEEPSTP